MKTMMLILLAAVATAAVAADSKDVSPEAKHEIARRGNHIEQTGVVRSGLIAAAFSTPADDSDRWNLSLVGKKGEAGFEQLKATLAKDPAMRPWLNLADPTQSFFIYQERYIDDERIKDWLKPVIEAVKKIEQHGQPGLPCLVLQTPRNGKYGDNAQVVKTIHGPVPGAELSEKLTDAMKFYLASIEQGPRGDISQENIGVAPPFNVQPKADPVPPPPETPFEWPPAKPKELTIEQVQAACPGATPEFLLSVVSSKQTDLNIVRLMWMVEQGKIDTNKLPRNPEGKEVLPVCPAEVKPKAIESPFSLPVSNGLNSILALVALSAVVSIATAIIVIMIATKVRTNQAALMADRLAPIRQTPFNDIPESIAQNSASSEPRKWRPNGPNTIARNESDSNG